MDSGMCFGRWGKGGEDGTVGRKPHEIDPAKRIAKRVAKWDEKETGNKNEIKTRNKNETKSCRSLFIRQHKKKKCCELGLVPLRFSF